MNVVSNGWKPVIKTLIISLCSVKWVEVSGVVFRPSCALVLKIEESPEFGKVIKILVADSTKVYFEVEPLATLEFDDHFHCYVVSGSGTPTQTISYSCLQSPIPYHIRILPGTFSTCTIVGKHYFTF